MKDTQHEDICAYRGKSGKIARARYHSSRSRVRISISSAILINARVRSKADQQLSALRYVIFLLR
jgi:hypothetical protein